MKNPVEGNFSHIHYTPPSTDGPFVFDGTHGRLRTAFLPQEHPMYEFTLPEAISRERFLKSLGGVRESEKMRILSVYDDITEAYGDETRRDGTPRADHSKITAAILIKVGIEDPDIIITGLLHDTVEETPEMYKAEDSRSNRELRQKAREGLILTHNRRVADGVLFITRPILDNIEIRTEDEANQRYNEQLSEALIADPLFILVKLADRIHNLWTMNQDPVERRSRQVVETLQMYTDFFQPALNRAADSKQLSTDGKTYLNDLFVSGLTKLQVPLG